MLLMRYQRSGDLAGRMRASMNMMSSYLVGVERHKLLGPLGWPLLTRLGLFEEAVCLNDKPPPQHELAQCTYLLLWLLACTWMLLLATDNHFFCD